jgi:hypothetical protein
MTNKPDRTRRWRTASYSGSGNNCVQVTADARPGIAVRDSKHPHGPVLVFTAGAWETFTRTIKASATTRQEL